jgi:hypothetical protein
MYGKVHNVIGKYPKPTCKHDVKVVNIL